MSRHESAQSAEATDGAVRRLRSDERPESGQHPLPQLRTPALMAPPIRTYEEAVTAAARVLADARAHQATLTAEQAAAEAYRPGGPPVAELADKIRRLRAQSHRAAA